MSNTWWKWPDDCRKICSLRKFVASWFNLSEAVSSIISIVSEVAKVLSNTWLISDDEKKELEQLKAKLQDKEEVNSKPNSMIEIAKKLWALWIRSILKQNEIIERKRKILEEQKAELERKERELKAHKEEIERRWKDALTWLLNRHALKWLLESLQSRYDKDWEKFSIAMIDIDRFKKINDDHWHGMWDRVLIILSERLIEKFWEDFCIRMWWEEVLIAFKWDAKTLLWELESFKAYFSWIEISDRRNPLVKVSATFSAWISEYDWWWIDDLIESTDGKLYHAKRTWRNRIVIERPQWD